MVKQYLQFCIQKPQFVNSFANKHKGFKGVSFGFVGWLVCLFSRSYSFLDVIKNDRVLLEEKEQVS